MTGIYYEIKEHFFPKVMWGEKVCCYNAALLPSSGVVTEPNSNISMFKAVLLIFSSFQAFLGFFVVVMCQDFHFFIYKHSHFQSGLKCHYGSDYQVPEGTQSLTTKQATVERKTRC